MVNGAFVSTWVESTAGRFWAIPEPGVDKPGLYACIFKQWEYHGSGFPPSDAKRLPWIRGHEQLNSLQLVDLIRALMDTYHAVAFVVFEDAALHRQLVDHFQEDLSAINWAGDVVPGLPNSRITGIQRGNGIARGKGPCSIKMEPALRRVWDAACVANDRPPVFNDDGGAPVPAAGGGALAPAANFVSPPDGVLWTTTRHLDFAGLQRHRDWEGDTCGSLQGLAYVWPPPLHALRCGTGFSFYPPHPDLCDRMEVLALTAWSSSPDCDYRTSPLPSLGSPKKPKKGWRVIGGPYWSKEDVLAMSAADRRTALARLPVHVRQLLPTEARASIPTNKEWLVKCGFSPLSGCHLQQAHEKFISTVTGPGPGNRNLFLRALAGGVAPGSKEARSYWGSGPQGIIASGTACLANSILFTDPGKLRRWVLAGGAQCTLGRADLQPSGKVGKARKMKGSLKSTKASNKKARKGR
jgi:hypothetical protein